MNYIRIELMNCTTPDGTEGLCMPISDCPDLTRRAAGMTDADETYIHSLNCSDEVRKVN